MSEKASEFVVKNPALVPTNDEGLDFKLVGDGCWITVQNLSIRIRDYGEGMSIAVYPLGDEMGSSIAETWELYVNVPREDQLSGRPEFHVDVPREDQLSERPKMVRIEVRGGNVQQVSCPPGIEYEIIDWDNADSTCKECGEPVDRRWAACLGCGERLR